MTTEDARCEDEAVELAEDREVLKEGSRERTWEGELGTLLDLALVVEMENVRVNAGVGVEV